MTRAEIENALTEILVEVAAVEPEEVIPTANLFHDLGMESIDELDLAFRCEKRFGVRLRLERTISGDDLQYDANGILTPESVEALRRRLPWLQLSEDEWERVRTPYDLFNVVSLANYVELLLDTATAAAASQRSD